MRVCPTPPLPSTSMALVPCRECGQQISTEAPICPHCGVPEPWRRSAPPPIPRLAPAATAPTSAPLSPAPSQVTPTGHGGAGLLAGVGALVVLLVVVALLASSGASEPGAARVEGSAENYTSTVVYTPPTPEELRREADSIVAAHPVGSLKELDALHLSALLDKVYLHGDSTETKTAAWLAATRRQNRQNQARQAAAAADSHAELIRSEARCKPSLQKVRRSVERPPAGTTG